jgi:hypothetical protein
MPDWKAEVSKRLSGLKVSPVNEAEIVEELAQHLDDVYRGALAGGMSETEATQAALSELAAEGLLLKDLERARQPPAPGPVPGETSKANVFADLLQDLRYAARILWKNPGFTAVAVIALALGIGANTAIFSVVNTVLLRPLPYNTPEQLVMVWEDSSRHGYPQDTPAAANFVDWRDQNSVFSGMAAIEDSTFNLTGVGEPERLKGREVSTNLFPLLGVDPQIGRVFAASEDQPGAHRVVLLSHRLWQRRFGGDPSIVGKVLTLNDEGYTVVGVMPARFQFPANDD